MKKITVLLVVFLSWANITYANVNINEFVSHPNDGGKEWVELRNTTGSRIDLTGWKLTELSSPSTVPVEKDLLLLSGFIDNIIVFDVGTTRLNDGGDSIGLYDGDTLIARITYGTDGTVKNYSIDLAAPLIGNSGALISSNWLANQIPTKGLSNSLEENNISLDEEDGSVATISSKSSADKDEPEIFKITTKIISPKIVTAGIAFSVSSLTTTNTGKTYNFGKFIWNFGDGMKIEVRESKLFDYIYEYPGEYILSLSYFDNSFVLVPDAIDRIIIKVIPSDIYISSIGTDMDPYVEIENKSKYEVNLSGWKINGVNKTFIFPEGTILLQGKKIKLSPKITGFTGSDIKYLVIENPSGAQVATYPERKKKIMQNSMINSSSYDNSNSVKNNLKDNSLPENSQIINLNDLGANASGAKVNISNPIYYILGLVFIMALGFASFLFIKKKKDVPDYLEKTLRPEDMTIIE